MKNALKLLALITVVALPWAAVLAGAVPQRASSATLVPTMASFQGQVKVDGTPFEGKGYLKFAIVDRDGGRTLWSNDGTSEGGGEPRFDVQLPVSAGLFNVLLGDTSVPNMTEPLLPDHIAAEHGHLRVWFSEDGSSFQQLRPDRPIASVPYALLAQEADNATTADNAATVANYQVGNSSGRIPINNGTLNADLNADQLDGRHSDFFHNASNIDLGTLSTHRFSAHADLFAEGYLDDASGDLAQNNGVVQPGLNADLLDGEHGDHYENASNIAAGTLSTSRFSSQADLSAEGYLGNASGDLAQNNGVLQQDLNADQLDGQHAIELGVPGGALVLGAHNDARLTDAGYTMLGATNVTCQGYAGHWLSTTGAPTGRRRHSAVWTGSEMIVWGGHDGTDWVNSGARYDPSTDAWTPTSTIDAPSGRYDYTAVWTGTELIVWGGEDGTGELNTGGRYDPASDTWTDITTVDAPIGRRWHSAVWTGSEMIVWGGAGGGHYLRDGGRYDPATDTWTATSLPSVTEERKEHTAVWTGSEMIVWGGATSVSLATGLRYDPTTNTWSDVTDTDAPSSRYQHTVVWSGSEMLVWGGYSSDVGANLNTGGRYDPATDTWLDISTTDAASVRASHTAVWTGTEMWVWGGFGGTDDLNTGGRYSPSADTWAAIPTADAPTARTYHTAVWTGSEMIVWGGSYWTTGPFDDGGRYSHVFYLYQKP
jgi:N-acetylneuraminic acid mutarotase